jgi:hypothetical protein
MLRVWSLAQLARYVPGTVVMIVGRIELGRRIGVPRRVSLAASVYEQALLLATAAIGGAVFLLTLSDARPAGELWLVALVPVGLALLHPRPFRAIADRGLRLVGREPLTDVLSGREVMSALCWYAVSNACVGLAVWMLVRAAAGPEAGGAAFVGTAYLLAFTVAMLAFVVPSGLGIRDGLLALALTENLPGGVAVAISIGVRLALTVIELGFVGIVLAAERRFRPETPHYHDRRPAS